MGEYDDLLGRGEYAEPTRDDLQRQLNAALARLKAREDDVDRLIDERDAALARNAELEKQMGWETRLMAATESDLETVEGRAAYQAVREEVHRLDTERLERAAHQVEALRAELDSLRDRLTALADEWDEHPNTAVIRETAAKRLRAIVRGSDDEGERE